jgi:alkanesulfonate monooxygenase SsuD/methylene tetrahydromethanopterin reductase-like flavin-dependent oxidoreductase (luciferase family)
MTASGFEIGLYTIGELSPNPHTGKKISTQQRIQEIVAAGRMADEAGLDVFAVGESHQPDFATSAHTVVLGALAASTKQIRLASSSSVISTMDPVRVFEDFATIDIISNGRAEIVAGRGSRVGSYQLFGYNLDDYDDLFVEKVELLLELNRKERVTWQGKFRSPLEDNLILPRPIQDPLPIWIAVGGTPESAARAGALGTPMTLAILGGPSLHFKNSVDIYRRFAAEAGHDPAKLPVAVTGFLHVQKDSQDAIDGYYPYYAKVMQQFFRRPVSKPEFLHSIGPHYAPMVGSPEQLIEKILYQHELYGHQRLLAQIDLGGMELSKIEKMIELLAIKVAPVVRREIAKRTEG